MFYSLFRLRPLALSLLLAGTLFLALPGVADPSGGALYQRADSWQATMLQNYERYQQWLDSNPYELGPWFVTAPLPAKNLAESHFPMDPFNLHVKGADDKRLFILNETYNDGVIHPLPKKDHATTYLFRKITTLRPITMRAGLGSDDGLSVWLNGHEILAKDVPRGIKANQDSLMLNLRKGENQLILKIHNQTGDHAFYFSGSVDMATPLWQAIAKDFPREAAWLTMDAVKRQPQKWFSMRQEPEFERNCIRAALMDLPDSEALNERLTALVNGKAPRTDPRWLALYVDARVARALTNNHGKEDMRPLYMAIEDLGSSFPEEYDLPYWVAQLKEWDAKRITMLADLNAGKTVSVKQLEALEKNLSEPLLANPLLDFDQLLLVKRSTKLLGLPQNWQGNCSVPAHGYDNEIAKLSLKTPERELSTLYQPENGAFVGDIDLHFDAEKMLVSMPGSHNRWQIWEITADGSSLKQMTTDAYSDVDSYDPCYLPDGRFVFASTGCFAGIPCVGGSDKVANLFLTDPKTNTTRQLCFDQDHNWSPVVMNNGRVMYARWEYSDIPHYFSRILFHMNPDGTNQMAYYGSNSYWPNSLFYARPIPDSPTKFVGIVSGHHGVPRMGELIVFDVAKGRTEAEGVVQRIPGFGQTVEPVIKDQLVNNSWPRFLHPYPLSDKYFLASCQPHPGAAWGIYLVDVFDNMTLLKELPGYALFEPVPFRKTVKPPIIPDRIRPDQDTGTVYLANIYEGNGLKGVPKGTVKQLRLYSFHYSYNRMGGHYEVGYEGPWDVHRILGTVPVQEDGSAYFTIPANTPIAVQPLDAEGKAIQIMRSWFTAMPGEVLSCTGCHENQNTAPPPRSALASYMKPDPITPWYGEERGFSFAREVQPVLDRYCVGCHNGEKEGRPDFQRTEKNKWRIFSSGYLALHPFVRRPGPEGDTHLSKPMEYHADTSPLVQLLQKGHHGVVLDEEAWSRIVTWIDLNAPQHGTWHEQRKVPENYHQRRLEMRTKYAGRPEDPEFIPEVFPFKEAGEPVFVKEDPARRAAVTCADWPFDATTAQAHQQRNAKSIKRTVDLGEGIGLDLVRIPAGEFVMGSLEGPPDQRPLAPVRIKEAFWMGSTEITLAQYQRFVKDHDQGFIDQQNKDHTRPGYSIDDPDYPVVRITWEEAMAFCDTLSKETGMNFTLPTEAQWEWACRAGSDQMLSFGPLENDFSSFANLADASLQNMAVRGIDPQPYANPSPFEAFLPRRQDINDGTMLLSKVGQYQANAWGLFDMHGNVAEWTLSAYRPYPYDPTDGRENAALNEKKSVRGGSWWDLPRWATNAYREAYQSWQPVHDVGFRVVCTDADEKVIAKNE